MNSTIIVLGSARSHGNTRKMVDFLIKKRPDWALIDLKTRQIGQFDYDFVHENDDFLPTIKKIVEYDSIIFATPVYWYSMSGLLKTFFDRLTDLLMQHKAVGRQLRGKNMALLCCSSDQEEYAFFNIPFKESATYLGMNYLGDVHTWVDEKDASISNEVQEKLLLFQQLIP